VVAIARSPEKLGEAQVEVRKSDYNSVDECAQAMRGLNTVVLVSSPAGPDNRIEMHQNVINAALQAGVKKVLYTSVVGDGREVETLYAPMAHINRQAERDLEASGLEWIVGRNGLYLEFDVEHIVNAAEQGGVFRNNGGEGRCTYITRDELAFAFARLAASEDHQNGIYNLVSESKTQAELVAIVNDAFSLNVRYEEITDEECFGKLEPVRGEVVANMLTGCYQSIRCGAFDVPSNYEAATGRPAKSVKDMVAGIKAQGIQRRF
jgi:NAD(P)H dehydrogenase (quinone)